MSHHQLPTILVVEHVQDASRRLEESLGRIGFEAVCVNSGERALAWLDEASRSGASVLALVDLHLAGTLNGVQVGHRLSAIYQVPFFYLARQASELQDSRVLKSQPYGYLLPPCGDDELLATLSMAAESLQERDREREESTALVTPATVEEGILVTDLMGRVTYMNPLAEELTGWTLVDGKGQMYQQVFRIVDDHGEPVNHKTGGRGTVASPSVVLLQQRAGGTVLIDERSSTLTDARGSLAGLFISFSLHQVAMTPPSGDDEQDRDGRYQDLGSERRMAAVVEAITDPLFAMDDRWNVTYANQQAEEHLGRPREALLGRNFWNEFPESVHAKYYYEYYKAATSQEPRDFEFYHEIRGRWMEVHVYPFTEGVLVFLRDITARRSAQERASKLEKLESLGLLARGFAHDFNNLLTVLLGNVSLARYSLPGDQSYYQSLDAAKQATEQARNLVQQLLTFAKGGVPITNTVDLNEEVIGDIMRNRPRLAHIEYDFHLTEEAVFVEADHEQLERLLENLMQNAEEAMLSGGRLRVTIKVITSLDPIRRELSANLDAHTEYVMLEVHDTGEGIAQSHMDKIFEPYFSTRTDANATGLGLTVCDSIARSHKGFLTINSRAGHHTTARLFLPALRQHWQARQEIPAASPRRKRPVNNPPRVLILDDERPIRLLMSISLKKDGYEVVETEEGSQTVEEYQSALAQGRCFDLVITDLSIPNGMGGAEAMQQIRYADPDVVAVVSSGYSDDPVMANYSQYGFSAVLPKPYEPSSLRELAHRLIKGETLSFDL